MANSYYDISVLPRELKILREIAKQHDLLPLFESLMRNTRKKEIKHKFVSGLAVTNSIRFSAKDIGINNIYDASLATNFVYEFFGKFSLKQCGEIISNNIKIVNEKYGYHKKKNLPSI